MADEAELVAVGVAEIAAVIIGMVLRPQARRAFVRAAHDPDQELDELEAVYREATTR